MNFANVFSNINPKEVLKNLPDAVFVVESDGKISWVNRKTADIFQTKKHVLKELYVDDIMFDGFAAIEKSFAKRRPIVTTAYYSDGVEFFVEINAQKYIEQYFIIMRNVSDYMTKEVLEEKARRLNREKNEMIVKLENEIKLPLYSMEGYAKTLVESMAGGFDEQQEKYLSNIYKGSKDLLFLMEKLIEFSRAESKAFVFEYVKVNIVDITNEVIKNCEHLALQKNLKFEFDYKFLKDKEIFTDIFAFKTILQNLIETSAKLSDENGIIFIKLFKTDNNALVISVNNAGTGVPQSELEDFFEPYAQMNKANKKALVRTLALGIVKTLAQKMEGSVWAEAGVIKGTSLNVQLPDYQEHVEEIVEEIDEEED